MRLTKFQVRANSDGFKRFQKILILVKVLLRRKRIFVCLFSISILFAFVSRFSRYGIFFERAFLCEVKDD